MLDENSGFRCMEDVPCNVYVDSEAVGKYAVGATIGIILFAAFSGKADFMENFKNETFPDGYYTDEEAEMLAEFLKPDIAIAMAEWAKSLQ